MRGYTEGSVTPESVPLSPENQRDSQRPVSSAERPPKSRWHHLAAALRFDGLWWRKLARLGCVYGPEWWKRGSPPLVALAIFVLVRRNRQGAIENQARVLGDRASRRHAVVAGYRTFAAFARCMAETMEYYGPNPRPFRIEEPKRNHVAEALERRRGVLLATAHLGHLAV
jgi:lauroyl/myristoyl acyltransferase